MPADETPPPRDETRLTEQPALTFSTGRIWLVVGGLFTAIALAVLIPEAISGLQPQWVTVAAVVVDVLLYVGMILARLLVPVTRLRRRLGLMAIGMLSIAAVSLAAVLVGGVRDAAGGGVTRGHLFR